MSIRFEVKSTKVEEKHVTGRSSGKTFVIREQAAYMDVGKPYPVEVKLRLQDLAPFEPGFYEVVQECFYVGRYGDVGVDLCKARPVAAAQAPARPASVSGGK